MASRLSPLTLTSGLSVFRQTDFNATSNDAMFTAAATVLKVFTIDNTANASQDVYGKFYNNAAPTIGTTVPDMIVMVPGGATVSVAIIGGTNLGFSFGTALSGACVTTAGTAGTTNPTSDVVLAATASI